MIAETPDSCAAAGTSRVADGIARAARWRLLGLLLERPRAGWSAEIERLAAEIDDPTFRAAASAARDTSEGEYHALLGPGAPLSPREASVLGLGDPGWNLSELARFFEAFGFVPRAEDPPDHVAVEVGFVGFLELKESLAWAYGDAEAAQTVAAARSAFVARHLAPLVARLERALEIAPHSALALTVDVLRAQLAA
jgi:nitrate reductase assembly molybdenum cofactor insertion protein NarJ